MVSSKGKKSASQLAHYLRAEPDAANCERAVPMCVQYHCVPVRFCPNPIVYQSGCVTILLCTSPFLNWDTGVQPQSLCVQVQLCTLVSSCWTGTLRANLRSCIFHTHPVPVPCVTLTLNPDLYYNPWTLQQQHRRLVLNNSWSPTGMSTLTHSLPHISGKDHDRRLRRS